MQDWDERREDAWRKGWAARVNGDGEKSCPMVCGTIFYDDWHDGWEEADRKVRQSVL